VDGDEYATWQAEYEKRDKDDHYVHNDPDPEGWAAYLAAAEGKDACAFTYASNVSRWNPLEGTL